ncbi:sulfatase-like hydrolase/transferase [Streptomyces sp. NPDC017868]|uniref:sulfatase-like hydrolase/transferase n=1 Tax=Streptomyces sp. NPDC017868 TaxID=3365014 RepID=UPI00379AA543
MEVDVPDSVGELHAAEAELADLLAEDDIANLAEAMEPGTTAGVLVWENVWAGPFAPERPEQPDRIDSRPPVPQRAGPATRHRAEGQGACPLKGTAVGPPPKSLPSLAPKAPEGAPNVLVIAWDDVGYGTTECFGGPVRTPTTSRIADLGVRYSNFHTTALCSPTRPHSAPPPGPRC